MEQNPEIKSEKKLLNVSLESLNEQAIKSTYSLDQIDWKIGADRNKFWIPEPLVSISHLPVYGVMSADLKKRFNQNNALGVAELFIFFEEKALVPSMSKALRAAKTPEFKKALQHFIAEEEKHSQCFKKVLFSAAPELYSESNFKFNFVNIPFVAKLLFDVLIKFPMLLPAWVWVAIFFEERTLMYSKEYIKAKKSNLGNIDELFYQVHFYHMMDEVRHVKLDEHMINAFYKTFSKAHARLVVWMTRRFIQRSAYPINMIKSCLAEIKMNAPHLLTQEIEYRILNEAKQLSQINSFVDLNFSDSAAPRTRILMNRFPEFKNFWQKIMNPVG